MMSWSTTPGILPTFPLPAAPPPPMGVPTSFPGAGPPESSAGSLLLRLHPMTACDRSRGRGRSRMDVVTPSLLSPRRRRGHLDDALAVLRSSAGVLLACPLTRGVETLLDLLADPPELSPWPGEHMGNTLADACHRRMPLPGHTMPLRGEPMALTTVDAFAAGFATGWVGRSVTGSTREAIVQALVVAHRVRDGARRIIAEQVEWGEDLLAEGRARYDLLRQAAPIDDDIPPQVLEMKKRERAA